MNIINPNGLGFVIIMTLPLLHFLISPIRRPAAPMGRGSLCDVLRAVLSASRSGFLAFVFLCLFVIWRSKYARPCWRLRSVGAIIPLSRL